LTDYNECIGAIFIDVDNQDRRAGGDAIVQRDGRAFHKPFLHHHVNLADAGAG
jgi:hypothetical protein